MSATRPGGVSASLLGEQLVEATGGRLSNLDWFSSPWSRGGGHTASASFQTESGSVDVIVKLPVEESELTWSVRFGDEGGMTPEVLAWGESLADTQTCWIVQERISGPCVADASDKTSIRGVLEASARFGIAASESRPPTTAPSPPDWAKLLEKARRVAKEQAVEDGQLWNKAIHHVEKVLPSLAASWAARPVNAWCHGDLHPGNAILRGGDPQRCVLIDLGLVHAGHWSEDALYFERLHWGRKTALEGLKPVSVVAKARRELGVPPEDGYTELADVKRLLEAASALAHYPNEGNPAYFRHAFGIVDRLLPVLSRSRRLP